MFQASELERWKAHAACFDSIMQNILGVGTTSLVKVLRFSSSPALKQWQPLEDMMRLKSQEAKEVVKYLYSLEPYTHHFYSGNPQAVRESLDAVLKATMLMANVCSNFSSQVQIVYDFRHVFRHDLVHVMLVDRWTTHIYTPEIYQTVI
jgi:hypothetical protein